MNGSRRLLQRVVLALASCCVGALAPLVAHAADNITETLIFVRHGEKPAEGLGQLDCKGLNRSLALPAVIAAKFGKPDVIFAPDPGQQKNDGGHPYYYVRPLATIEPTAIQFQLPVQTPYGFAQIDQLGSALVDPAYHHKLVVIAWEHKEIEKLVRQMVAAHGGNAADVPKWHSDDFDSIYVVKLDWQGSSPRVTFVHDHEGLNDRSADCPCASLPDAAASAAH
ncbi:histidine phosphatase family protein [Paraburkholderia sp. DHOC27]|uniref:histidine phosphatase family protein n=1 Tax=Paraburkholderia sp. DHOC27 TaxID=2303330 RepID=UPI000E3D729B|nr:histidine phosphatase family protein [Paraburkholderia sp. DHOC27]RFU47476.1 histidine phosphatase family protein [Paraburkholderia sp. DHOC27]